jgi:hypothetical protein
MPKAIEMSHAKDSSHPLAGAWELVSGSYLGDDGVLVNCEAAGIKSLKVLSERKFSFVTSAKGTFYAAGSGDYSAEDGKYVETPRLASHETMIGQRFEFDFLLDGDVWTNTRWQDGVQVEHEVWKRVG